MEPKIYGINGSAIQSEKEELRKQHERIGRLFKERRVKYFAIPEDLILETLLGHVRAKGFPESSVMRGASYQPETHSWNILILHESFSPIQAGTVAPSIELTLERVRK